MIYFISDIHNGERINGLEKYLSFCKEDDLLIILGDVGFKFRNTDESRAFDEFFLTLQTNIAFIDGNHENNNYLNSLPVEKWCCGKVHRLSEKIIHLIRGNIYEICGKTFLCMGGGKSSEWWAKQGLWYEDEEPSDREMSLAYENLKKYGNKVDYVLTHKYQKNAENTEQIDKFINFVEKNVEYRHWYSGHWHKTEKLDGRHTTVYDEPIMIEQGEI